MRARYRSSALPAVVIVIVAWLGALTPPARSVCLSLTQQDNETIVWRQGGSYFGQTFAISSECTLRQVDLWFVNSDYDATFCVGTGRHVPASQPLLCFPVALTAMGMTSIMLPRPIYFENSGVDYNWYVKTSVTNGIHVGRYDAYEEGYACLEHHNECSGPYDVAFQMHIVAYRSDGTFPPDSMSENGELDELQLGNGLYEPLDMDHYIFVLHASRFTGADNCVSSCAPTSVGVFNLVTHELFNLNVQTKQKTTRDGVITFDGVVFSSIFLSYGNLDEHFEVQLTVSQEGAVVITINGLENADPPALMAEHIVRVEQPGMGRAQDRLTLAYNSTDLIPGENQRLHELSVYTTPAVFHFYPSTYLKKAWAEHYPAEVAAQRTVHYIDVVVEMADDVCPDGLYGHCSCEAASTCPVMFYQLGNADMTSHRFTLNRYFLVDEGDQYIQED